jgi:DNA primase
MAIISPETVAKIYDSIRIEEVIGDFVNLKKRGANYVALSPFVNEKTPSFYVSPAKGIFKCFSSGIGGDAVKFIMEHEKVSYPEALRYLAKKYNIEIEEKELDDQAKQAINEREQLFVLNKFAFDFFVNQLHNTEEGKAIGLTYLVQRGLTLNTIKNFGLGYSPENKRAFTDYALINGYSIEQLVKAGLTVQNERGNYDFFAGRITFPFYNISGRIIGFSARTLSSDKNIAKYKNSPETVVYQKSQTLFGLYQARKTIVADNNCFLAEGQMDVISLSQAGLENVVASSGTSLTIEQIRLIKRYAKQITILYDADKAGIKATLRGIDLILQEGLSVKMVLFPENEDPDSYSKKVTNTELKEYIKNNSVDFIRYKTKVLLNETQNDPIKKTEVIKDIVKSISFIPDPIARSVYIKECSNLLEVEEQILINEINKLLRQRYLEEKNKQTKTSEIKDTENKLPALPEQIEEQPKEEPLTISDNPIERDVARVIVKYSNHIIYIKDRDENGDILPNDIPISVAEFIYNSLESDHITFEHPIYRQVYEAMAECLNNNIIPDANYFLKHPNTEIQQFAITENTNRYELSEKWLEKYGIYTPSEDKVINDWIHGSVYSMKIRTVNRLKQNLINQLKTTSTNEPIEPILEMIKLYDEAIKAIGKERGRVILK